MACLQDPYTIRRKSATFVQKQACDSTCKALAQASHIDTAQALKGTGITSACIVDSYSMADRVRGYLTVTVVEALGKSKEDEIVWEDHFQEGFVKGTIRDALQLQNDYRLRDCVLFQLK